MTHQIKEQKCICVKLHSKTILELLLICGEQQSYFEVSLFLYGKVFIWKVSIPKGNFSDTQVYGSSLYPESHYSKRALF